MAWLPRVGSGQIEVVGVVHGVKVTRGMKCLPLRGPAPLNTRLDTLTHCRGWFVGSARVRGVVPRWGCCLLVAAPRHSGVVVRIFCISGGAGRRVCAPRVCILCHRPQHAVRQATARPGWKGATSVLEASSTCARLQQGLINISPPQQGRIFHIRNTRRDACLYQRV